MITPFEDGSSRIFLCYRRNGVMTARAFYDAFRRIPDFEYGKVWFSDAHALGNYELDVKRLLAEAEYAILFLEKGFTERFLNEDGTPNITGEDICVTALEILEIERQRQARGKEFRVLCINYNGYKLTKEELKDLKKLFESKDLLLEDSIQAYSALNQNTYLPQIATEDYLKEERFDFLRLPPVPKRDLLEQCRTSLHHIAQQIGVDIDEGIDDRLFCSIYPAEGDKKQRNTPVDLLDRICANDHKHILLQADGGFGKTYTVLSMMKRLLDTDRPCAYIRCQLFSSPDSNTQQQNQNADMIFKQLESEFSAPHDLLKYLNRQGEEAFILFLDGYNEAVTKNKLASEIKYLGNSFPHIKIVVSSRYNDPVFANYTRYLMKGLDLLKVKDILREKGRDYDALPYSLRKILITPMFLSLYRRIGTDADRSIDTAAELMDAERKRKLDDVGIESPTYATKEQCLNELFPDFVRNEYLSANKSMSFYLGKLNDFLDNRGIAQEAKNTIIEFLVKNSIIHLVDERMDRYTYQHEHFRDYWVAYSVFRDLLRKAADDKTKGPEKANAIIQTIEEDHSQTVLRFVGELSQVNVSGNPLDRVLDCMRRDPVHDDAAWKSERNAKAVARLIDVYKSVLEENLIGKDLSGLNLTSAQLNQAQTCARNRKASFTGSLIDDDTFVVSMHESAPRRIELLKTEKKFYLVTISNTDMLISTLPEMEHVRRYPHVDENGVPVSTGVLTSSTILGSCIMAADAKGCAWEWDLSLKDGIPVPSPVRKHEEAQDARKVFPRTDGQRALIALQRGDGTIMQYAEVGTGEDGKTILEEVGDPLPIHVLDGVDTRKTMTSSPDDPYIFWAARADDTIQIWRYDVEEEISEQLCTIPDGNAIPDYMICVGTEQLSRKAIGLPFGTSNQDGTMLILAAICHEHTDVYQIDLPLPGLEAHYTRLEWFDGNEHLENRFDQTELQYNKINAASFAGGNMLLAASDGCVYKFRFDQAEGRFIPDDIVQKIRISDRKFPIEDVLYVPTSIDEPDRELQAAAVSVERSVHLLDAGTMFEKKKLPGFNDGLRRLLPISHDHLLVTSYDGCVIDLRRNGSGMICTDKLPVGTWCWALSEIRRPIYAAGYLDGLALVDVRRDEVLCRIDGFKQKVEQLLYMPDVEHGTLISVSQDAVRVYGLRAENRTMWLKEMGELSLPVSFRFFWAERKGSMLYVSINESDEQQGLHDMHPRLARFDLNKPLIDQKPILMDMPDMFGRIRDIRFPGHYLMVSGLGGSDGEPNSSQIRFFDISDPVTEVSEPVDGFGSYIVHSAVFDLGDGTYRMAVIDSQANGKLYQYLLKEEPDGRLTHEKVSEKVFPAVLCDVAFDNKGDLLLTCLNGCLYEKEWFSENYTESFRNKCYMLTFGADMSGLAKKVDPESTLGQILTDFGNKLE